MGRFDGAGQTPRFKTDIKVEGEVNTDTMSQAPVKATGEKKPMEHNVEAKAQEPVRKSESGRYNGLEYDSSPGSTGTDIDYA